MLPAKKAFVLLLLPRLKQTHLINRATEEPNLLLAARGTAHKNI